MKRSSNSDRFEKYLRIGARYTSGGFQMLDGRAFPQLRSGSAVEIIVDESRTRNLRSGRPCKAWKFFEREKVMTEQQSPPTKTFSFGGSDFNRTSPKIEALSPQTQVLNVEVDFEEALKLHLAIGECIRRLNSYKRSTKAGKRTALNIAIHLSKGRITINEARSQVASAAGA